MGRGGLNALLEMMVGRRAGGNILVQRDDAIVFQAGDQQIVKFLEDHFVKGEKVHRHVVVADMKHPAVPLAGRLLPAKETAALL